MKLTMSYKYNKATKKEKGEILDSLIELTGYNCSYAARVLRNPSKPKELRRTRRGKHTLTLIEDERTKRKAQRKRAARYNHRCSSRCRYNMDVHAYYYTIQPAI